MLFRFQFHLPAGGCTFIYHWICLMHWCQSSGLEINWSVFNWPKQNWKKKSNLTNSWTCLLQCITFRDFNLGWAIVWNKGGSSQNHLKKGFCRGQRNHWHTEHNEHKTAKERTWLKLWKSLCLISCYLANNVYFFLCILKDEICKILYIKTIFGRSFL